LTAILNQNAPGFGGLRWIVEDGRSQEELSGLAVCPVIGQVEHVHVEPREDTKKVLVR